MVVCAERVEELERKLAETEETKTKVESELSNVSGWLAEVEFGRTTARNEVENLEKNLEATTNRLVEMESELTAVKQKNFEVGQPVASDSGTGGGDESVVDNVSGVGEEGSVMGGDTVTDEHDDEDQNELNPCCVQAVK